MTTRTSIAAASGPNSSAENPEARSQEELEEISRARGRHSQSSRR